MEAWLPPYGPRLHLLHRPGSWVLEHVAPCFTSSTTNQAPGTLSHEGSCQVGCHVDRWLHLRNVCPPVP